MKDKTNYPGKSRKHINILLEPHRGELLSEYVKKVDKKRSDVLREIIYSFLCEEYGPEIYSQAVAKDQSEWEQVIQNRTDGRALSKMIRTTQANKKDEEPFKKWMEENVKPEIEVETKKEEETVDEEKKEDK